MAEKTDNILEALSRQLIFDDYPGTNSSTKEAARWPTGLLGSWKTMDSIGPSVLATAVYLILVLRIIPSYMEKKKKPFLLTLPMALYNLFQIVFSWWMFYQVFYKWENLSYFVDAIINASNHQLDHEKEYFFSSRAWYYLMCKYIEFLDTIFFVLRGKGNQVSFLHIYHHTNMAISTWVYVRYVRATHLMPLMAANSFVHCIMYSYYLLAGMGPAVRPYLWWKRYITQLQLIQFVVILIYMAIAIYHRCPIQKFFFVYTIINTSIFISLFVHFYLKTYFPKNSTASKKKVSVNDVSNGFGNGHLKQVNGHSKQIVNGNLNEHSNGHVNGYLNEYSNVSEGETGNNKTTKIE